MEKRWVLEWGRLLIHIQRQSIAGCLFIYSFLEERGDIMKLKKPPDDTTRTKENLKGGN